MTRLTFAFLGVAHIHTPDFVRRINERGDNAAVKYVYDREQARAEIRSNELEGSAVTDSVEAALNDPEIDAVIVCAETSLHRDLVVRAAGAGKHIFCEKPLAIGAVDAEIMADAVKAAGVVFQTGFFQRSSPANRFIKQEVLAGHLGKITRVRYSNCHHAALAGWFDTDWRWLAEKKWSGGGALLDMGAHPLDLLINTFVPTEGNIVGMSSSLGNRGGRYGNEIDEYGTGLFTFESGASAVIEASWVDPALRSATEVFGTEGQIQVKDGVVYYYSTHVDGADGKTPTLDLPTVAPHAFELFIDKLLGKSLPIELVSVDEARLGSALMEKLYEQNLNVSLIS